MTITLLLSSVFPFLSFFSRYSSFNDGPVDFELGRSLDSFLSHLLNGTHDPEIVG